MIQDAYPSSYGIQYIPRGFCWDDDSVVPCGFKVGSTSVGRLATRIREIEKNTCRVLRDERWYCLVAATMAPTRNRAYIMENAVRDYYEHNLGYEVGATLDHFIGYETNPQELYSNPWIQKAMNLAGATLCLN